MSGSTNKTQATNASVDEFVSKIEDAQKKADSIVLIELFREVTKQEPVMWGPSIIGFGQYHYRYESGREGDMAAIGFSPRKGDISLYLVDGASKYAKQLSILGPHKTAKVCVYIKRLSDIDISVLREVAKLSYEHVSTW